MHERVTITRWVLGPFAENCYLLVGPSGKRAALVDPGIDSEPILDTIREQGLELEWIVNTHGHLDHVAGNAFYKRMTGAPIIIHPDDEPMLQSLQRQGQHFGLSVENSPAPDVHFEEGQPFVFDGLRFDVLHTPGHSPGGVCLRFGDRMLVGDTLFQGSIGRTDLPGGSLRDLVASIRQKLFALPGQIRCFTGHGEETTLEQEKRSNPFVGDAAVARLSEEFS